MVRTAPSSATRISVAGSVLTSLVPDAAARSLRNETNRAVASAPYSLHPCVSTKASSSLSSSEVLRLRHAVWIARSSSILIFASSTKFHLATLLQRPRKRAGVAVQLPHSRQPILALLDLATDLVRLCRIPFLLLPGRTLSGEICRAWTAGCPNVR